MAHSSGIPSDNGDSGLHPDDHARSSWFASNLAERRRQHRSRAQSIPQDQTHDKKSAINKDPHTVRKPSFNPPGSQPAGVNVGHDTNSSNVEASAVPPTSTDEEMGHERHAHHHHLHDDDYESSDYTTDGSEADEEEHHLDTVVEVRHPSTSIGSMLRVLKFAILAFRCHRSSSSSCVPPF